MGKINQGILGGFRNKVGSVVGYFRYGEALMRGLAGSVSNPRTPHQEAARARFALIAKTVSAVQGFINVFYPQQGSMTRGNLAVRTNLQNGCIQGTGTNVTIDYTQFAPSYGGYLANPANPAASQGTGHTIDVSWTDNTGVSPEVLSTDIVCVLLYNPSKNVATYDVSSASRLDASLTIAYPQLWVGDEVHVYLATRNIPGTVISDSQHIASITAA